jgi:hypothetical protein
MFWTVLPFAAIAHSFARSVGGRTTQSLGVNMPETVPILEKRLQQIRVLTGCPSD